MSDCIMMGCDLHMKTMVLRYAIGRGMVQSQTYANDRPGRRTMIEAFRRLQRKHRSDRILFAYEASSEGFGLYDELREADVECHVLAPTRMARSAKHARSKSDGRDAVQILELLRGHVLAGNPLPTVWVPDVQTRDDRELVRMRLEVGDRRVGVKNQVQSLLKRNQVRRSAEVGNAWTRNYWGWLRGLAEGKVEGLGAGGRAALSTLLRQMESLEAEIEDLDEKVEELSRSARYAQPARWVQTIKGVGVLSAMVFLTELGDVNRFSNRRELAAYLGLVPTSNETGERSDCKGHITRQGPGRVRKVLCQCTWSLIRTDPDFSACYKALVERNPKRRKIAVVAIMRRLAIIMWRRAKEGPPDLARQRPSAVPA